MVDVWIVFGSTYEKALIKHFKLKDQALLEAFLEGIEAGVRWSNFEVAHSEADAERLLELLP